MVGGGLLHYTPPPKNDCVHNFSCDDDPLVLTMHVACFVYSLSEQVMLLRHKTKNTVCVVTML